MSETTENKKESMMDKTTKSIDKNRRFCTLSEEMIKMLVIQLGAELTNKHLYMTFANFFGTNGLPKLEEYFIKRAEEEELHHRWIFWYLGYCDAEFQYPAIEPIQVEIPNLEYQSLATVDREIETTMGINKIVEQALSEKDWATFNWLHGSNKDEGMLVREQIEEESLSRTIADIASQEGANWLNKQEKILNFYVESR